MRFLKTDKILVAWIILVFIGIALPGDEIPHINPMINFDKVVHMILFGVVTFLVNASLRAKGSPQKFAVIISFIAGAAYAGLAELIQLFVPGRNCSLYDFYAGAIGAVVALAIFYALKIGQVKRTLL